MKAVMALPPSLISIGMELIGMDLRNMRIMSLSGSCGRLPASPSAYTDATILEPTGSSAHSPNVDHSSSGRALPSPSSVTTATAAMSRLDVPTSTVYSPASTCQSLNFSDQ